MRHQIAEKKSEKEKLKPMDGKMRQGENKLELKGGMTQKEKKGQSNKV